MATSVALTPHFETLAQRLVAGGRYNNVSEVIRDGLRLLEARELDEAARLQALRDAAKQGFAAIERGQYHSLNTSSDIRSMVRQAGVKAKKLALAANENT